MQEQFERTALLLGEESIVRLQNARVIVFGVGGVGSFVVESLARAGVGAIDIVDNDTVAPSNLNRQLVALHSTIGLYKVDVAEKRILDINPACRVTKHCCFFTPETSSQFDFSAYSYVVDCIDTVTGKIELIRLAKEAHVPVISSMGTGNKLDPTQFEIADIAHTSVCPLARVMRHELNKRGITGVKVLFSKEQPCIKRQTPGSVSFVPSVAGLIIAGEIIKDIAGV